MKSQYTKYEVRLLVKGFLKTIHYLEKEDALEAIEIFKENEYISKISLFKVIEKYEKIDI